MSKTCCKCKLVLDLEYFGKLKNSKDGYKYECKKCRHEYTVLNRDRIKEKNRLYYAENKEHILSQNQEYRVINSEAIRLQRKEYRNREEVKIHIKNKQKEYLPVRKEAIKIRRLNDLNYRLQEVYRSKLHRGINGINTSYTTILGCDFDFLKKWITFNFDNTMNWDNYGTVWHIDHILPINSFNLSCTNELQICFHWTNLQPLYATENQSKSDKILPHYYFNNLINVFRFNSVYKQYIGYQAINESLKWLRSKLRYGNNSLYDGGNTPEIDNPQPSL